MLKIFLTLAMLLFATSHALTQIRLSYLIVSDNGSGSDLLSFGYMVDATCGIDSIIPCEAAEPPPPPPAGILDARWIGCSEGRKCDVRGYRLPTTIDTFTVKFQPSDAGFPMSFRWDREAVEGMCDSAWFQDYFGGFFFRVRMDVDSQFTLSNPTLSSARIILFGQDPLTVIEDGETAPESFALHQNYPNPFNPSTRIEYRIPAKEFVQLRIFDVLGKEISTLVNQVQSHGTHVAEFAGDGFPSGVYFYRLEAGTFVEQKKMLLLK